MTSNGSQPRGKHAAPEAPEDNGRLQVQSAHDALREEAETWYETHPDPDAIRAQMEAEALAANAPLHEGTLVEEPEEALEAMPSALPALDIEGGVNLEGADVELELVDEDSAASVVSMEEVIKTEGAEPNPDEPSAADAAAAAAAAAAVQEQAAKYSRGGAKYTSNEQVQKAAHRKNAPEVDIANYRAEAYVKGGAKYTPMHIEPAPERKRKSRGKRIRSVVAAILAIIAIGIGGYFGVQYFIANGPVQATVNGEEITLQPEQRTTDGILDAEIVSVEPGNHIAVDKEVITEGGGNRAVVTINEEKQALDTRINEGDVVEITDGDDTMEEYTDSAEEVLPAGFKQSGEGPVHQFITEGKDGKKVKRTGKESNKTVEVVTEDKVDHVFMKYNPMTHGEKVIALTFDDGPWPTTTTQILDILKENGAHATFFTIGNQVADHPGEIQRMVNEGHQICTHSWDHAAGSGRGVDLSLMSEQEQRDEITKGYDAIKSATGKDASTVIRSPGGNYPAEVAENLQDLVSAEINWNVDTEDWRKPGSAAIETAIMGAFNGNIILMHDGGGDRSQTVEALKSALPKLKAQGFEFVTIDELLERFPYNEEDYK